MDEKAIVEAARAITKERMRRENTVGVDTPSVTDVADARAAIAAYEAALWVPDIPAEHESFIVRLPGHGEDFDDYALGFVKNGSPRYREDEKKHIRVEVGTLFRPLPSPPEAE